MPTFIEKKTTHQICLIQYQICFVKQNQFHTEFGTLQTHHENLLTILNCVAINKTEVNWQNIDSFMHNFTKKTFLINLSVLNTAITHVY